MSASREAAFVARIDAIEAAQRELDHALDVLDDAIRDGSDLALARAHEALGRLLGADAPASATVVDLATVRRREGT
jgi:hypothetical protein